MSKSHTEFETAFDYHNFARALKRRKRYSRDIEIQNFINAVSDSAKNRETVIRAETKLYRAQIGVEDIADETTGELIDVRSFSSKRMMPDRKYIGDGRANFSGIPVLYLGSSEKVAISEVRPWIDSEISLSILKINTDLKALNLTEGHKNSSFGFLSLSDDPYERLKTPEQKEKAVWTDIDAAFSRPVDKSDDKNSYLPTQALSEIFSDSGYDAIIYRSNFDVNGINVAIFDPSKAQPICGCPYKIKTIEFGFEQHGNSWSKNSTFPHDHDSKKTR